ncbi:acyl-CoA dehydrogenase family protein [Halocynthiibacter namhaensis]|uniref:acyl-CoA dehydrogenase family protein n=1 Tax=Halocynthiibacter namhaensis TaxID=1290553 RepID=UPI0005791A91|nr:acyl-CoA dehydrogenase family protein [Halocynthiibacter namhaensis]
MLDPETRTLFLDTTQKFVNEVLIPAEAEVSETDQIPDTIVSQMKDLGLFGLSIPEEFGGLGLSMTDEVEVAMILGQASPAFRSLAGTNIGIGSQAIIFGGTDDQRRTYLPPMASGDLIGSFALTEPDVGSDAASVKTSARKTDGGYVLNGTKRFITNAPEAGLFTVMARTGGAGAKGVSCFLVEADSTGLSVGAWDKKMGQKGAHTADVILDDCFVPDDALLGGQEGTGFTAAMRTLDKGRLHISAICAGAARRLMDEALRYSVERQQFGKPIAEFQLVQAMLAESQTEIYAAESMIRDAARQRDDGEDTGMLASCCKLYASEMVGRVADRAVQIFGGAGYMADYPIERFYRDVRLFRLYEGTSEIQKIIIAKAMIRRLKQS